MEGVTKNRRQQKRNFMRNEAKNKAYTKVCGQVGGGLEGHHSNTSNFRGRAILLTRQDEE